MKRPRTRVWMAFLVVVLTLGGSGSLVACGPTPTPVATTVVSSPVATTVAEPSPTPTVDPGLTTLYMGGSLEPNEFDPAVSVSTVSGVRFYPSIYETLIRYAPDGSLQPMLAESWEVSEDGLVYRFNLRQDVKFSDGTPFNAEAVKKSFDRFFALGIGFVSMFEMIDEVQVIDDYTVDIRIDYPYAPMLSVLAAWQAGLFVSPTAVEQHETDGDYAQGWMFDHTAGTGPFMLESWEPEVRVVMVRNPYYRDPPAPDDIQRVIYQIVREPATLRELLENGDLDLGEEIAPDLVEPLREAPGVEVAVEPTQGEPYAQTVIFNLTREPFNDVNFRRAVAYAIDYDPVVAVWAGIAVKAQGPFPSTFAPWFSEEDVVSYEQNLDKAADMLREAGYSVPIDPPLKVELIWQGGWNQQRDMGTLIKEDLSKLGIEVEVIETELPVWRELVWNKDYDMAFFQNALRFADPDSIMYMTFHSAEIRYKGWNPGYSNPRVDELIENGRKETDQQARVEIYNELQHIVTDEVALLFLINKQHAYAYRSNLSGIVWNPFYGAHFDPSQMKKVAE
jgi:peptide/nickel transport system substrate-binding protein